MLFPFAAGQTLGRLIREGIGRHDGVAAIHDGAALTRDAFLGMAAGRQAQLLNAGIAPGSAVIVTSRRGAIMWTDLLALWAMGCVAVPIDPQASAAQKAAVASKARPLAILGTEKDAGTFGAGAPVLPAPDAIAADDLLVDESRHDEPGAILFTSGSTGESKGVLLKQRAILGNSLAITTRLPIKETDRLFIAVPYHFTSPICHFIAIAIAGGCIAGTEKSLLPSDLHKALVDSDATAFGGSPIQIRWVAECATPDSAGRICWMMSSGDRLGVDVIDRVQSRMPSTQLVTVYGLTEVGGRFCALPADDLARHEGSVGWPIPGMYVEIVDEMQRPLPHGEIGEVHAFGDFVFDEYVADAEITKRVKSARGGFLTGDVGRIDEHGMLHVVGRNDDVFKCAGQKVCILPINDALMQTGVFEDVAAFAADDEMFGKVPHVCYVAKNGVTVRRGDVMRQLRDVLPANHLPQKMIAVPQIPRTSTGKLQRTRFMQILQELGYA